MEGKKLISARGLVFVKVVWLVVYLVPPALLCAYGLVLSFADWHALKVVAAGGVMLAMSIYHYRIILAQADQVWDLGDALLIRRGRTEQKMLLSDISGIENSKHAFSVYVIRFVSPNSFGASISFRAPLVDRQLWTGNTIIKELRVRIAQAKERRLETAPQGGSLP